MIDTLVVYGAALIVLGVVALLLRFGSGSPRLAGHFTWLSVFGFLHGVAAYFAAWRLYHGVAWPWTVMLLFASFGVLTEFSRRVALDWAISGGRRWTRVLGVPVVYTPLVGVVLLMSLTSVDPENALRAAGRYFLAFPASCAAAILLPQVLGVHPVEDRAATRTLRASFFAFGVLVGLVTDRVPGFPEWLVTNDDVVPRLGGVQMQALRAAAAVGIAASLVVLVGRQARRLGESDRAITAQLRDFAATLQQQVATEVARQQEIERALHEHDERLRQVVSFSRIGIFDHNHVTGLLYLSPESREIHGIPPGDAVPVGQDFIHPDDRDRVREATARAHDPRGDGWYASEYRIVRPDGTMRWVSAEARTFFEGEGALRRPVRTIGAAMDTTDRRAVQEALQASETKYRQLVESSQDAILTMSYEGQYLYANQAAATLVGRRSPDEIVGTYPEAHFSPDVAASSRAGVTRVMETGQVVRAERYATIGGRRVWFNSIMQPIRDASGAITAVQVTSRDVSPLMLAEEALRVSEARLQQVVRLSAIGVFDHDHATGDVYWSPQHRDIYGWAPDEHWPFQRFQSLDVVFPEDRDRLWEAIRRAHEADGLFDMVYRIVRPDGAVRWVSARAQTFFEGERGARRATRTIGATVDITARTEVQEALRRSEERLREAVQVNGIGIFEHDHVRDIYWASPEQRGLYGWGPDETPTMEMLLVNVAPADRARVTEAIRRAHDPSGDGSFESEHWITRQDGTRMRLHARSQTVFDGAGAARRPVRTVGAVVDVTERTKAEEALRASEGRLRQAQAIARLGNWEVDLESNQLTWSEEHFHLFEVEAAGLPPSYEAFVEAVHVEDRDRLSAAFEASLADLQPRQVTHRLLMPGGRIKHVEERWEFDLAADGRPVRCRGTVQDVTARVVTEEALRESLVEKETLVREVHHRVKNNLQMIASLLRFQARKIKNPEHVAVFRETRERLGAMILVHEKLYQSTGLSRIDLGTYVADLVEGLRQSYLTLAPNVETRVKAAHLHVPIEVALPCGMIVSELLTNVFKYAFPDGRRGSADVHLAADLARFELTVADDGVGMPAGDSVSPSSFGMSLVTSLVRQLGGTLERHSGPGTRVTVTFPVPERFDA